jgi:hypothetical protein
MYNSLMATFNGIFLFVHDWEVDLVTLFFDLLYLF